MLNSKSLFLTICIASLGNAAENQATITDTGSVHFDANNIHAWILNDGSLVSHKPTGNAGLEWPAGSGYTAVFTGGLWIVAGKIDGANVIRTACAEYSSEFVPGRLNVSTSKTGPFSIHTGDTSADPDWVNWPVELGAPWYDVNANGEYEPEIDRPLTKGNQFIWYSMNDGGDHHNHLFGTDSMGLDISTAVYGYNDRGDALNNTIFYEWNIRNAGVHELDSVFLALWMDPDIGDATDDYGGYDRNLQMGYAYNGTGSDTQYGSTPPAVGVLFLQTPVVSSVDDTAYTYQQGIIPDHKNLDVTSCLVWRCAGPLCSPENPAEVFYQLNGLDNDGLPILNPDSIESKFMFDGDPVTGEGWTEARAEISPGDRYLLMSVGPFSLSPEESQDIAAALVIEKGTNELDAITQLGRSAASGRDAWNDGLNTILVSREDEFQIHPRINELGKAFPNPFNASTTISYTLNQKADIRFQLYDITGSEVAHWEFPNLLPGQYTLSWDGQSLHGDEQPSGIYILTMFGEGIQESVKMTLLK